MNLIYNTTQQAMAKFQNTEFWEKLPTVTIAFLLDLYNLLHRWEHNFFLPNRWSFNGFSGHEILRQKVNGEKLTGMLLMWPVHCWISYAWINGCWGNRNYMNSTSERYSVIVLSAYVDITVRLNMTSIYMLRLLLQHLLVYCHVIGKSHKYTSHCFFDPFSDLHSP